MSLPSNAIFYKNDSEVGIGFCNIGWFLSKDNILRCCLNAMQDAREFFMSEEEYVELHLKDRHYPSPTVERCKKDYENCRTYNEKHSLGMYFTTLEDLHSFDYVKLYGYKCYRKDIMDCLNKIITETEFVNKLEIYEW